MAEVIGIVSLKGGVGKTSVTSSLGASLASFGKKVLLVDANFSSPNLGLHHNIVSPEKTLHDVLRNKVNPREAIQELENFDILPATLYNRYQTNYLKLREKLKYLKRKYDYIIIDSSPALNEETLAVLLASDKIFVVTTPDHPTLSTTINAIRIARKKQTPIEGLILNKAYNKKFEIDFDEIEKISEVPIMAAIPHDIKHLKSLSEFTPYSTYKKSKGSEEYKKLAAAIAREKHPKTKIKRYLKFSPKKPDINRTIFYQSIFK